VSADPNPNPNYNPTPRLDTRRQSTQFALTTGFWVIMQFKVAMRYRLKRHMVIKDRTSDIC